MLLARAILPPTGPNRSHWMVCECWLTGGGWWILVLVTGRWMVPWYPRTTLPRYHATMMWYPRGPKHQKTCSWVQNFEDHVSAIDFGRTSAQGSKTLKIMFLGSILHILPPRGPKEDNRASGGHASSCSWQGPYFRPRVQIVLTGWCVSVG